MREYVNVVHNAVPGTQDAKIKKLVKRTMVKATRRREPGDYGLGGGNDKVLIRIDKCSHQTQ